MDDSSSIISVVPKLMQTNWKSIYIIAVVAFLSSLELAVSNDWNYFCQLDSSATITFYGILRTVGGLSAGISTLIAGWMCNRLKDTRQVLIASKMLIFTAFAFFLSVELVHGFLFYLFFLLYKVFMGIAMGGGAMARTHVAMASTEEDRNKAIGWCSLFPAIGLLIAFLLNAATSFLQYPGFQMPLISIHLNLFTVPVLFAMSIFLLALYLLVFHFDGKWKNYEKLEQIKQQQQQEGQHKKFGTNVMINLIRINTKGWIQQQEEGPQPALKTRFKSLIGECSHRDQFDWVAVLICLFTQLVMSLAMLNLLTINAPYQQLAFQLDAAQLQFYMGLSGAAVALQLIFWPAAYMVFGLNKIISERNSVMLSLAILLGGYLITYNWPFLSQTIPYAYSNTAIPSSSSSSLTSSINSTPSAADGVSASNCGGVSDPAGCHYLWCATTTRPNLIVYMTAFVLTIGMAMPILRMNLDILYSKVLGNIKQGFMQGLCMLFQSVLEMAGAPIIVSWVFEKMGPKHIWEFISFSLAFCFFLWFIFYKRMIPNSERLAKRAEKEKNHLQKNTCPDPVVISSSSV